MEGECWRENQTCFFISLAVWRGIWEVGVNRAGINGARVKRAVAEGGLLHLGGCWEITGWSEKTGLSQSSPQKQSQTWNLLEQWNTLDSGRELGRILCTAEKVVVQMNLPWSKHVSRRLYWKESGPVAILELQNDEEELWCYFSGLTRFFLDTLKRAVPEYPENLRAENQIELQRLR